MRPGKLPAILLGTAMVLILTLQPLISGQQGAGHDPKPDISVISLIAHPDPEGDFDIELVLKNIGDEVSSRCLAYFWDEYDIVNGNRTFVTQMSVPPLSENEEFIIKVKWDPRTITPHRLWAVVGPDPDIKEVTKSNNVGSYLLQMPRISGIFTYLDGEPDPRIVGNFISGIPLDIPLSVELDMDVDRSLVKIYLEKDEQQVFVPYQTDGSFGQEIGVGDLPPGTSKFSINSSYAMIQMAPFDFQIRNHPLPTWTGDLIDLDSSYDLENECYRISGYLDVPDMEKQIRMTGMNGTTKIVLFSGRNDLLVSANIMLDGTALLDIEGKISIDLEGGSASVPVRKRYRLSDAWAKDELLINGEDTISDLDLFKGANYFEHYLDDGRTLETFVDPKIQGNLSYMIKLDLGNEGISQTIDIDLLMWGNDTFIGTDPAPGFDKPVVEISSHVDLDLTFNLDGSTTWEQIGSFLVNNTIKIVDTGLSISGEDTIWDIPLIGSGTGFAISPEGIPGTFQVVQGLGHNSDLSYRYNGSMIRLNSENRYMSSPGISFLPDGSPMVIWTKAGEWSPDPLARIGSMRLYYSMGSAEGIFPANGTVLTTSGMMELHPDIAGNGEGMIATVWTQDEDSDPRTLHDNEIMISIFSGSSWSEPEKITSNSLWDDNAKITFDEEGAIWITWTSEGGKCKYKRYDPLTGLSSLTRTLMSSLGDEIVISSQISTMRNDDLIIGVLSRTDDDVPVHFIRTVLGDFEQGDIGTEVINIASSSEGLSDIFLSKDGVHDPLLSWRSLEDNGIWTSEGNSDPFDINWSYPLPLGSGKGIQYDPAIAPLGNGIVLATYIDLNRANSSEPTMRPMKEIDLSNAARILDVRSSIQGEYKRWGTVSLSVDLENIGISDECNVYVNLDRESRDPTTGIIKRISVSSDLVQFSERHQIKTVGFNPTLVEHQLRYFIWTSSGWGDPPAYISEKFVHIPVVSDPVVDRVVVSEPDDLFSSKVSITVKNQGIVTEDPLVIDILGEIGSPMMNLSVPDIETAGIRDENDATLLNTTSDGLGSETTRTYEMNITLGPGRNVIWIRLKMSDGRSITYGPYISDLFPELQIVREGDLLLTGKEEGLLIGLIVQNNGPVDGYPGDDKGNISISISIEDMNENEVLGPFMNETFIPQSGEHTDLSFLIPVDQLDTGSYLVRSEISGDPGSITRTTIVVVDEANISIVGWDERDKGYSGREFGITVSNNSTRTQGVVRVVLFNGYPRDDVVIAEGFITNIEPGNQGMVNITFDLDEGTYFLTMICSTSGFQDTSSPWIESAGEEISFTYSVSEPFRNAQTDDEVDMDDVNDTLLIGASACVTVILISALFRRKDEEENDEK